MTPNQVTAIAATVRALLEDGQRQNLTPAFDPARVQSLFTSDAYRVVTHWREPEGEYVVLSVLVWPDGTVTEQPAAWADTTADPERRPGVRLNEDGEPMYSAEWLP